MSTPSLTHPRDQLQMPLDALPAAIRELAEQLGEAHALRLVGVAGGARLTIPKRVMPGHPLGMSLGHELFARLVEVFPGEPLDVPKADAIMRELRHAQVRSLRADGLTMDEIAIQTGYCRRQVISILTGEADRGRDTFTMDMFADDQEASDSASVLPADLPKFGAHNPWGANP